MDFEDKRKKINSVLDNALGMQNSVLSKYLNKLKTWEDWYKGHYAPLHEYCVKNWMGASVKKSRNTAFLAKKICTDWASLVGAVIVTTESQAVHDFLEKHNFQSRWLDFLESTFAIGNGLIVYYGDEHTHGRLVFFSGTNCIPIAWDDVEPYEFICFSTISSRLGEQQEVTIVNIREGAATFVMDAPPTQQSDLNFYTDVKTCYIKPAVYDNFLNTNLGVSIFANSEDTLYQVDTIYNSLREEFELGKKRIIVDASATKASKALSHQTNPSVQFIHYFDSNDTVFMSINDEDNHLADGRPMVQEVDMSLRVEEHRQALLYNLSLLTEQCGLGSSYYDISNTSQPKTATEVVSEHSATFRNKKKHEQVMVSNLAKFFGSIFTSTKDIQVSFDDSIVEDDSKRREEDRQDVVVGIMPIKQYLLRNLNLTEEQAEEWIGSIAVVDDGEQP